MRLVARINDGTLQGGFETHHLFEKLRSLGELEGRCFIKGRLGLGAYLAGAHHNLA